MNIESTFIDPRNAGNQAQTNNATVNHHGKAVLGKKTAYATGGAVAGGGMAVAGQTLASNTNEVSPEQPAEPTAEPTSQPETEAATAKTATGGSETPTAATTEVATAEVAEVNTESVDTQAAIPEPEDTIVATATGVRVAQVEDSASFSQAFADARAQVGAGGVFEWREGVYSTYYKEEWDGMSAAERHNFQASIDYNAVRNPHHDALRHTDDMAQQQSGSDPAHQPTDDGYHETNNVNQQSDDDCEVRVLDVAQTDLNDDGIPEDAALLEVNGHEMLIVDIDTNSYADVLIADVNDDRELKVLDISDEGIPMPTQADIDTHYIPTDAPDYIDSADIDMCTI